jgi:hypothetical protein
MISEKDATATSAAADNQAGALTGQARAVVPVAQAAAVGDASAQGAKIADRASSVSASASTSSTGSGKRVEPLLREQRFAAALGARKEGKGVQPRQGCASEQLNRECKEGTKTPEFAKFMDLARRTAEAEVLARYGTNAASFDRADFLQVDRPLTCKWDTQCCICGV